MPASAPSATSTPKLVISKLPLTGRVGYTASGRVRTAPSQADRMPEVAERLAAGAERRAQQRLALGDVGGVLGQRDVVDVEVRVGMVAEVGARIQPQIEKATHLIERQVPVPASVDEPDDRDA